MGTSKGHSMPTGGEWTPLKTEATKFVKSGGGSGGGTPSPKHLVGHYLVVQRTSGSLGGSSAGTGGGKGGGTGAAVSMGQRLGRFLSSVAENGLSEALRELNLSDLIGKSADEVANGLIDVLAGASSTLDDEAVRNGISQLKEELFDSAESYEDMEATFTEILDQDGVVKTVANFFGKYIYRLFCRDFYEEWQRKAGAEEAGRKIGEVKDYIFATVKTEINGGKGTLNWNGKAGGDLSHQILEDTLDIFGVR